MIVFVVILGLITLQGISIRKATPLLSKEMTTAVNGIFAICIFLTHCSEYILISQSMGDTLYRHFQNFHNQWIVAGFLAFSGYGVMSQLQKKGKVYLREYPKIRLAKTIFNFDIAVLLYLLMNGILSIKYSVMDIAGSFVGITSVGNSNWYIFAVLVMYVLSYICARIFKEDKIAQAVGVTLGTIVYIAVMQLAGMPSRFISTILCYSAGVWICVYKDRILYLFKKHRVVSIVAILFILVSTYKLRYNDYIMNISSIVFVFAIVYFNVFCEIKSRILQFVGRHAFSIYILQRIPMTIFSYYGILEEYKYVFVIVTFSITVLVSILFDYLIEKMDKVLFVRRGVKDVI